MKIEPHITHGPHAKPRSPHSRRGWVYASALLLALVAASALVILHSGAGVRDQPPLTVPTSVPVTFHVPYTGLNYHEPAEEVPGCLSWSWLRAECYRNAGDNSSHVSPRQQFIADMAFLQRSHLGSFQRVWISLDQLMWWDPRTGYQGYRPQSLANVDDMLHNAARFGMKVDLVLLTWSHGIDDVHQFHPEALDGRHGTMRSNYLRAVRQFVEHVAADPIDVKTIAVMDLENEAYFQLEEYFNNPANLGAYGACANGNRTDWGCVDRLIIHPWVSDLYHAAKAVAPHLLFTVSDVGYLLEDYAHWGPLYPVDVYDIHAYQDPPWRYAALYRRALRLPKPWFAGETGCQFTDPNAACWTYHGDDPATVAADRWWLEHLRRDGARAVLIETQATVWHSPAGPLSRTLTETGKILAAATAGR